MAASTLAGVREFFGLDDDWVRPLPPGWQRRDAVIAVVFLLGAVVELEAMRALGLPRGTWGRPALYAATLVGMLPLVWRRRFPLAVMLLLAAHMFAFGMAQYVVMGNLAMQAAYFFSIFTALAWGRDRRMTMVAASAVVVFMFGWVAVQLSVASGRDALVDAYGNGRGTRDDALFGPGTGAVLTSVMMNVLFFVTAVATGANSWRGARARGGSSDRGRAGAPAIARMVAASAAWPPEVMTTSESRHPPPPAVLSPTRSLTNQRRNSGTPATGGRVNASARRDTRRTAAATDSCGSSSASGYPPCIAIVSCGTMRSVDAVTGTPERSGPSAAVCQSTSRRASRRRNATNVPSPERVSPIPSATSAASARCTVTGPAPNCFANSRVDGSRDPAA